jgi:hypothetical protein
MSKKTNHTNWHEQPTTHKTNQSYFTSKIGTSLKPELIFIKEGRKKPVCFYKQDARCFRHLHMKQARNRKKNNMVA